jgi:hypothetical protein
MTAPLTAEVAQMASEMRNRTEFSRAGIRPDSRCVAAADMLTALATQLAERDAELARVTREAEIHRASAVDNYEKWDAAQARIATLTEALEETAQTLAWQIFGSCRGFSENLLHPNEALALARAALTTDKEPKT